MKKNKSSEFSNYVRIGGLLGIIFFGIVFLFVLFAREFIVVLNSIVWAFVVLGIVLSVFEYKSSQDKKRK